MEQKFTVKAKGVAEWKQAICPFACVVLEAKLVGILVDTTIDEAGKKKRISTVMTKVGTYSKLFSADLRSLMVKKLLTTAMGKLTDP